MRQFYETYRGDEKVAPLVRQLPWTHNLLILGRSKRAEEREFYLRMALQERWGKRELERQFGSALFERVVLSPPKMTAFLNERFRGLRLEHVQCDEIWTFVGKKQGRLSESEQGDETIGDQFLYVALDQDTKLIPAHRVGKRNRANTEAFMLDLAGRIVTPRLTGPGFRPVISTDGWAAYPGAVDLAFAGTVRHGVLIKQYAESEQPGRYGPPTLTGEDRRPLSAGLLPDDICTSHVERSNLTIRTFMRRFTRLALGFSKKLDNLRAATALYVAHYNFCRRHGTLGGTPAMAAGLTRHRWPMSELMRAAGMV